MTTIPYGYCHCGCGERTEPEPKTVTRLGVRRGEPRRWAALGHQCRKPLDSRWIEEDRGFKTPCWIWQWAACRDTGYGMYRFDGRATSAHRAIYLEMGGRVPRGFHVDHLCRVPICVNPAHMEPVTIAENKRRAPTTKLTMRKAQAIRALCAQGVSQQVIAARYGINASMVSLINSNKRWRADR